MSEVAWTQVVETDRLILRPQKSSDYEVWYAGFSGRLPQQSKYDEGKVSLKGCDPAWFSQLCAHHQEQALSDYAYIFGVFSKQTAQHLVVSHLCFDLFDAHHILDPAIKKSPRRLIVGAVIAQPI